MSERYRVRVERTQVHDVTVDAADRTDAISKAVERADVETPSTDTVTARIREDGHYDEAAYL